VHPIERLRYVARASGAPQGDLVRETAHALASFHGDPSGLVAACRRIVDRHPTSAALWWLCARVLTSPDPRRESWEAVEAIEDDPTAAELCHALPDGATVCVIGWPEQAGEALPRRGDLDVLAVDTLGEASGLVRRLMAAGSDATDVPQAGLGAAASESDLVLLEGIAMGPEGVLAVAGSRAAAATARHARVPVWVTVGVGRLLPERMWDALVRRLDDRGADPWDLDEEVVPLDLIDQVCGPAGLEVPSAALARTDCPVAPELLTPGRAPGTFAGP
jgi:hypothetical protein